MNGGSDSAAPLERPFCAGKNCNFYGDPVTGFCSKCARDKIKSDQQQPSSVKPFAPTPSAPIAIPSAAAAAGAAAAASAVAFSGSPASPGSLSLSMTPPSSVTPPSGQMEGRCFSCKKKTGLLGFECRCGFSFCSAHRHHDAHNCTFDYKSLGREQLTKNNPLIMHKKIDQI